jgi:hypothetical protein
MTRDGAIYSTVLAGLGMELYDYPLHKPVANLPWLLSASFL